MRAINYQSLRNKMLTEKPFRGTTNKYPLVRRSSNTHYFFHEVLDDGSDQMRIIIGKDWSSEPITEEVYEKEMAEGKKYVYKYIHPDTNEASFTHWVVTPSEIGIVRPDNTFEFTRKKYGQGTNTIMGRFNAGYFVSDCRRGGMIYKHTTHGANTMVPIFQGLRVDCDTMKPDPKHEYKLYGMRVARGDAKRYLERYETFYRVSNAMLSVMSYARVCEMAKDICKPIIDAKVERPQYQPMHCDKLWAFAKTTMDDSPLEAAIVAAMAFNVNNIFWDVFHYPHRAEKASMEGFSETLKRKVNRMLYAENPDVMHRVEFPFGVVYPQSSWDYTIEVDGKEVKQCY